MRSGMMNLINDLRGLTETGEGDYTVNGLSYWTADQLEVELDRTRTDILHVAIEAQPEYSSGGTVVYKRYPLPFGNLEETTGGTAIFYLQAVGGSVVASGWTADYRRGLVEFNADTGGSVYYLTARAYELNSAAARIWRQKAAHYVSAYDVRTDNHQLTRSQLRQGCMEMAQLYDRQSGPTMIELGRSDDVA